MRKHLSIVILLLFSTAAVQAGLFSSSDRGSDAAQFLKLDAGARAAAMGDAYVAAADDATSLFWNPAGLALLPEHSLSATFMHAPYLASSYFDYGAWAENFGGNGAFGASIQSFSAGSIAQTDEVGSSLGTFSPYDVAASIGYGRQFLGYSVGMVGKFIRSQIVDSAQTEAVDFGVMTPWLLNDRLRLGASAANIGGSLKYEEAAAGLPRQYRFGSLWKVKERWVATADLAFPEDDSPAFAIGTEKNWSLGSRTSVAARAGFNSRTVGQVDKFTGFSFGGGLQFDTVSIDYAFLPMGALGNTHRMSVSVRFNTNRAPEPVNLATHPLSSSLCDNFHGVGICDIPHGTFYTQYSVSEDGGEPYHLIGPEVSPTPLSLPYPFTPPISADKEK